MSLGMFLMMANGESVELVNITAENTDSGSGNTAELIFKNDGFISVSLTTNIHEWLLSGSAADFDVRLTETFTTGPSIGGAAMSTWLNAGTTRTWTFTGTQFNSATATLEILRTGGDAPLASSTITFQIN